MLCARILFLSIERCSHTLSARENDKEDRHKSKRKIQTIAIEPIWCCDAERTLRLTTTRTKRAVQCTNQMNIGVEHRFTMQITKAYHLSLPTYTRIRTHNIYLMIFLALFGSLCSFTHCSNSSVGGRSSRRRNREGEKASTSQTNWPKSNNRSKFQSEKKMKMMKATERTVDEWRGERGRQIPGWANPL